MILSVQITYSQKSPEIVSPSASLYINHQVLLAVLGAGFEETLPLGRTGKDSLH